VRALAVLLVTAIAAPASGATLLGFGLGAEWAQGPRFRIDAGLDVLTRSGLAFAARALLRHDLDASLYAGLGAAGPGLLAGEGLALGANLGPIASLDLDGHLRAGGRAAIVVGLWLHRATLELDGGVGWAIDSGRPEWRAGVALRFVPFSAWR